MAKATGLKQVDTGVDRFDRPVFDVFRWEDVALPGPSDQSPPAWSWAVTFEPGDPEGLRNEISLPVNFGGVMEFLGHDRSTNVLSPGETIELVLHWRLLQRPDLQYFIFVHLLDAQGNVVGGYDANHYPTSFWQEDGGERLLSYFPVRLNPETPPGEYQVEIGVYNQPTGQRLQIYEGEEAVADRLLLSPVQGR